MFLDSTDDVFEMRKNPALADGYDSFLEGYVRQELCVHLHFRLCSADGELDFGNYCAVFVCVPVDRDFVANVIGTANMEAPSQRIKECHCEQLVFISRVKFFKEPERVRLWVRSLIWLATNDLDQCLRMDSFKPPIDSL
jgi:hypothetical protein